MAVEIGWRLERETMNPSCGRLVNVYAISRREHEEPQEDHGVSQCEALRFRPGGSGRLSPDIIRADREQTMEDGGLGQVPERSADWMRQADLDLSQATDSLRLAHYEWACYAAEQAAEKAVKALFQSFNLDAWGHTISILLTKLPADVIPEQELIDGAKVLDKHYTLSRYPNGFDSGAPGDLYTKGEAETAVKIAGEIIAFCKNHLR